MEDVAVGDVPAVGGADLPLPAEIAEHIPAVLTGSLAAGIDGAELSEVGRDTVGGDLVR